MVRTEVGLTATMALVVRVLVQGKLSGPPMPAMHTRITASEVDTSSG
jgi:hypothetical protein